MDANELIDQLGGTNKVARLFEISGASVSGWRRDGIPKARLQTLRLMHPELFSVERNAPTSERVLPSADGGIVR